MDDVIIDSKRLNNNLDTIYSGDEKNKLPKLSKYGSRKHMLVNLAGDENSGIHTKSMRTLS